MMHERYINGDKVRTAGTQDEQTINKIEEPRCMIDEHVKYNSCVELGWDHVKLQAESVDSYFLVVPQFPPTSTRSISSMSLGAPIPSIALNRMGLIQTAPCQSCNPDCKIT